VADMMFLWATGVVDKVGIPRLNFNGTSFFCMFFFDSLKRCDPHKRVVSDFEPSIVPELPDQIKKTRLQMQLPDYLKQTTENGLTS
jgi:hypothetical protein